MNRPRTVESRARPIVRDPQRLVDRMPWTSLRLLIHGDEERRSQVISRLQTFALELLRWNQGVSNLISHDDEPRLVERHIAESLAGADVINALGCNVLVDFGSGGGVPAIPLVVAGVGAHWTLVESRRNKTLFLRRAIQELALSNVDVLTGRLEVLVETEPDVLRCDGFTSRATTKLGPTLALAARVVSAGGHAVLWKGSGVHEELAASASDWGRSWEAPAAHVIGEGPNSIVVFKRKQDS